MHNETLFEKFGRVAMDSVQARALLKEIVRVHALPADGAEAVAEREAMLSRLCQMAQEELNAPPVFVKARRHRWFAGLAGLLHRRQSA